MGNGVLDSDGVLYLMIPDESKPVTDVIAIQTRSPGLAPSAWPMIRHDNRGTMWLVSPASQPALDGGLPMMDAASSPDEPTDGAVAGGVDAASDVPLE